MLFWCVYHLLHNVKFNCANMFDTVFSFDAAMAEDEYYVAGVAISLSLVHGGPAPRFLAPELYSALVSSPEKVTVAVSALPEITWKRDLEAVSFKSLVCTNAYVRWESVLCSYLSGHLKGMWCVTICMQAHWKLYASLREHGKWLRCCTNDRLPTISQTN